jgi:hypothetical protein
MAVSVLNSWTIEGDYPTNGHAMIPSAGANRVGILVATGEIQNDAGGAMQMGAVTWGGQTVTELHDVSCGDVTSYNDFVYLGYINESGIAAMSGGTISLTWVNGNSGVGPFGNGKVAAAIYQGVDQSNIVSASGSNTTGATSGTASNINMGASSIDVDVDEQVIVATVSGQGSTSDDFNAPAGWTQAAEVIGATNDHNIAVFTRDGQTNDDALNTNFVCDSANRLAICSISLGSAALAVEQEGFRFRNDDGNETAATWRQAQDVVDSIPKNTNFRLRVLANHTGDPSSQQVTLQYRKVGDADSEWRDIPL